MKKAIKIIPITITFIAFIVLAIVILYPNFDKNKSSSKFSDKQIFATSILVTVDDTISLTLGTSLHFCEQPYTVNPINCNQEVKYEILDSKNKVTSDANFQNGYFNTNLTGVYYLRFFVAKNSKSFVKDTIKINVCETTNENNIMMKIKKYSISIYENEIYNLNDMVEFVNTEDYLFKYNGIEVENGNFSSCDSGTHIIEAVISFSGYEIVTNLKIIVKEAEKNEFIIKDINGEKIKNGDTLVLYLSSKVIFLHISESYISHQEVSITSSKEEIVTVSCDLPILKLNLKNKGNSAITIINLTTQNSVTIYIEVV